MLERQYRAHAGDVLAYLRRLVDGRASAEDLLHDVFVQAARSEQRLAAAASPRAWLFAVARHLALSALRRRTTLALVDDPLAVPVDDEDPRLERMRSAIATLPAEQREPLELRLGHDLSYAEIATALGLPLGTVRSRLHRAVAALRATLTDEGTT